MPHRNKNKLSLQPIKLSSFSTMIKPVKLETLKGGLPSDQTCTTCTEGFDTEQTDCLFLLPSESNCGGPLN